MHLYDPIHQPTALDVVSPTKAVLNDFEHRWSQFHNNRLKCSSSCSVDGGGSSTFTNATTIANHLVDYRAYEKSDANKWVRAHTKNSFFGSPSYKLWLYVDFWWAISTNGKNSAIKTSERGKIQCIRFGVDFFLSLFCFRDFLHLFVCLRCLRPFASSCIHWANGERRHRRTHLFSFHSRPNFSSKDKFSALFSFPMKENWIKTLDVFQRENRTMQNC